MTHYKLYEARQQRLNLREQGGDYKLKGIDALGTRSPKDQETELLSQILERLNDLFTGENLTDQDKINWFNTLKDKVQENDNVMEQVCNNTPEQAMLGDFPGAVQSAVIESMAAHNEQGTQFLSSERITKQVTELLLQLIRQGL